MPRETSKHPLRALIAIATYNRAAELEALLSSLDPQAAALGADVVVVDNDAAGSARSIAEASPVVTRYVIEPEPGIAQARNRGLDEFDERYDVIIFVDDDEIAHTDWLQQHLDYLQSSGSDITLGAVYTEIPDDAPRWLREGGYLQRGIPPTGTVCPSAATNNTCVRRTAWIAAGSPRFNPAFSATGGSDTDFFQKLTERGLLIRFVAEAIVDEPTPATRLTRRWVARRMTRNGVVAGRVMAEREGRRAVVRYGFGEVRRGVRFVASDLRHRRPISATSSRTLLMGVGELYSVLGGRIYEYKRAK
ncbi:glycosyltransferase family 2 protein [Antiquaquibacter oligotrophicus]|uniref:glycosyltransferase family 2 protein n=1 Tax=Antiquaquibacter oligotrophicus TaxID=2880260 RepID=UPI002AC8B27C|nr:glycosyltransferase [Antiquaquibacter oligotrophicus]UDF13120.1 glycosyltransferase family 2 protein [Antiquaquibacter oligotrophicus]